MRENEMQRTQERQEPTIEIPMSLFIALITGQVEIEMKSISLNDFLEKEKVN